MQDKIIDIDTIIRWMLTVVVLYLASAVINKYPQFMITLAVVASIFCETYCYLWQRERRKRRHGK